MFQAPPATTAEDAPQGEEALAEEGGAGAEDHEPAAAGGEEAEVASGEPGGGDEAGEDEAGEGKAPEG